jgi:hypothetical protein
MTKPTTDEPAADPNAALSEIADKMRASGAIPAIEPTSEPTDPMLTGMAYIKSIDPDAQRMWKVAGPKGVGGEIMAVLVNDSEVVLVHQRASGKFTTFRKADLKADAQ